MGTEFHFKLSSFTLPASLPILTYSDKLATYCLLTSENALCVCVTTEMAKQVCPGFRELAPAARGGITKPRTNFFGQLCIAQSVLGDYVEKVA